MRLTLALTILAATFATTGLFANDKDKTVTEIADAKVRLYEGKNLQTRIMTIKGGKDVADFRSAETGDGVKNINDKVSSVTFLIPKGWKLVLFNDVNFRDTEYTLKGTGKYVQLDDLGPFSRKASSARWERSSK